MATLLQKQCIFCERTPFEVSLFIEGSLPGSGVCDDCLVTLAETHLTVDMEDVT